MIFLPHKYQQECQAMGSTRRRFLQAGLSGAATAATLAAKDDARAPQDISAKVKPFELDELHHRRTSGWDEVREIQPHVLSPRSTSPASRLSINKGRPSIA